MPTSRIQYNSPLSRQIIADLLTTDFFLLDVGASGGIGEHWKVFGDKLRAIGFDPLVMEIERLNNESPSPKIKYEAAFVGSNRSELLSAENFMVDRVTAKNLQPFPKTSAAAALEHMNVDFIREHYNHNQVIKYAECRLELDTFIAPEERQNIDFLKVDTDGHDFAVLLGAENLLREGGILGLSVEAQFHGPVHDHANLFCNIDRFLRGLGYTLFDLETCHYSRKQLPLPFVYDLPAQTEQGQLIWGEAVYFRDLADPEYSRMFKFAISEEKVLKLACLYDIFGLPDCAAELILAFQNEYSSFQNAEKLLNCLVPTHANSSNSLSYRAYCDHFAKDPTRLYPSNINRVTKDENLRAQQELEMENENVIRELGQIRKEYYRILNSISWKLTKPLRELNLHLSK